MFSADFNLDRSLPCGVKLTTRAVPWVREYQLGLTTFAMIYCTLWILLSEAREHLRQIAARLDCSITARSAYVAFERNVVSVYLRCANSKGCDGLGETALRQAVLGADSLHGAFGMPFNCPPIPRSCDAWPAYLPNLSCLLKDLLLAQCQ